VNAAIFFESDAYLLDGPKLMGRQSAGNGFLRAAARANAGGALHAVTATRTTAEAFARALRQLEPTIRPHWIPTARQDLIAAHGVLYRPDSNIAVPARTRLRTGSARFSVCGVTHTLCTHAAAEAAAELVTGPLMPWDALVCTSQAGRGAIEAVIEAQEDYLAWRFGAPLASARPELPVIPLGVHCDDFAFGPAERAAARDALGLVDGEVAALFAGRLTFSGKAHPFQMFQGLEAVARATGRKLAFLLAGQFASPTIEETYRASARAFCPSVRVIFVDGKDAASFGQTWRAADFFLSLSDNYQETFGITPVEAMASGLPVVVSDWDGYKETVRDGVDGFRIPSWAPQPGGAGELIAADYETLTINYDYYLSRTSTAVSVDAAILVERLSALVTDADLRRRMGAAGAARTRQVFDWPVVYRQYQALWRELNEIRARRAQDPALRLERAPRAAPTRLDPFQAFASYPTRHIGPQTRVRVRAAASAAAHAALTEQVMLSFWRASPEWIERAFGALGAEVLTLEALAARLGEPVAPTLERVARLAKMELVQLLPGETEGSGG
jgi:glycosyltransferase involved in cell wall biosynthesis